MDENSTNPKKYFGKYYNDEFNENYIGKATLNECAVDGFCSIDPIVYSLLEVLLYELKQLTYYYIKMRELGYENKFVKNRIINYLSIILIGYEFNQNEFQNILEEINTQKESVRKSYTAVCDEQNIDCQILKSNINFRKSKYHLKTDLYKLVTQGEQQAIRRNKSLNSDIKNLYEIILNIIKSSSTRLLELKSYTEDYLPEEDAILKLFNNLNFSTMSEEKLTKKINDFAKVNYEIHKKLHQYKEEYYGKISLNEVNIGVKAGKSVLVSGQNLKDLESLLESVKDTNINVYTHNGLIVAHAYPKFKKYKNLIGHYQISIDSVQYDFASFKGPVLVIRNFQYLLDKLYRGRIYTTNIIADKGMSKIQNNDFSELVQSAENSEGFLHNHKIASVKVGYKEEDVFEKVDKIIAKIKNKEIKHLIVIGLMNHSKIYSEYFEEIEKCLPDDFFVISTILPSDKENVLYFDSFFNSSLIYKILNYIKSEIDFKDFPVSFFITTCNLHTISHLFNLKYLGIKNIYLPECTSNVITPVMLKFLKTKFGFKQVSKNPKKDLEDLL